MPEPTPTTLALRALIHKRRNDFQTLLNRYHATNPRYFGSIARGTAHPNSDIDILVDMHPDDGNLLMRAGGLMHDTRELYGRARRHRHLPLPFGEQRECALFH